MQTNKTTRQPIQSRLWRNTALPGLDFAQSQYADHRFKPHFHDHYVIQLVEHGVNEGICERKRFQITTGDILIIHPGEIHTGNSFEGKTLRYRSLYPTQEFMQVLGTPTLPVFDTRHIRDAVLAKKFRKLLALSELADESFNLETTTADFFGSLLDRYSGNKPEQASLYDQCKTEAIKDFIRENYQHNFSLEELSTYAGLSPYYLIRMFKTSVGMPPFEFLRNYRIEKAKELIRRRRPLTDVAFQTGFYDQSHFTRHFKSITGLTPLAYARKGQ